MLNLVGEPVSDAESFVQGASKHCREIPVLSVTSADIEKDKAELDERWQSVILLPRTHRTKCETSESTCS